MLEENSIAADLIIGRDFLNDQKITAIFNPSPLTTENTQDFPVSLLQLLECQIINSLEDKI